jgi:lipid-A-disaccharide synthase
VKVLLSCGEASGDLYAGAFVSALRARLPHVVAMGLGGPRFQAAGGRLVADFRRVSVTGLVEVIRVMPAAWRLLRQLGQLAARERPDVFVAIDFPDFNFRLLPVMKRLGIPIVYYVSPQVWAWRPGRLKVIRRYVDRMLVIFPFEHPIYEQAGVPVEFVGHPMVELAVAGEPRAALFARAGLDPSRPVVALLPGSRPSELRHLLPGLVAAAGVIAGRRPDCQFVVARAPSLDDRLFAPVVERGGAGPAIAMVEGATDAVLAASDVAVTASGTATVQAALHGTPMVIVYKLAPLSYAIGRRLVRLETFGMVNLIAGRRVVPELIQDACTPEAVAGEVLSLLTDRSRQAAMRRDLADVKARLGGAGASRRAAEATINACRASAS